MAKRDFLFIDESGEPGTQTDYYVLGLVHLTESSLQAINTQLGAVRFFGNIHKELKSTRLNPKQKELLNSILKYSVYDSVFIKMTVIYVNKSEYDGPYLQDKPNYPKDAKKFRHFMLRRLLETHYENTSVQSTETEIIIDRFHSSEFDEGVMRGYLRKDKHNTLPAFLHIIQADSRYVDVLQVTDWVTGVVKEHYFTHPERDHAGLLENIYVKNITR